MSLSLLRTRIVAQAAKFAATGHPGKCVLSATAYLPTCILLRFLFLSSLSLSFFLSRHREPRAPWKAVNGTAVMPTRQIGTVWCTRVCVPLTHRQCPQAGPFIDRRRRRRRTTRVYRVGVDRSSPVTHAWIAHSVWDPRCTRSPVVADMSNRALTRTRGFATGMNTLPLPE